MSNSGSGVGPTVDTNVRLTEAQTWGYGISSVANDLMQYWLNVYMMFYFTDMMEIPPIYIAPLMLIVRAFDAINDPFFGMLQDRSKSRWGRYRPFMLWGGFAFAACLNIIFNGNAEWPILAKVAFMYISYILTTVFATIMGMARGAFMCVITSDEISRNKMASRRMVSSNATAGLGGLLAVSLLTHFSNSGAGGDFNQRGFTSAVLTMTVAACLVNIVSVKSNIERIKPNPNEKKNTVKQSFRTLKGNRPAFFAYLAYALFGFINYGIQTMFTYYYTYVGNDPTLVGTHGIFYAFGSVCGTFVIGPLVVKRVNDKKYGMMSGLLVMGAMYLLLRFVAGPLGGPVGDVPGLYWATIFVCFCGMGVFLTTLFTCMPDIVDLGEYNSGVNAAGFLSAIASFSIKFGGAFGPTVGSAMLASAGYVANQAQTPQAIQAIMTNISIVPGCVAVIGGLSLLGYNLSKKQTAEIRAELDIRRAAKAAALEEGPEQS